MLKNIDDKSIDLSYDGTCYYDKLKQCSNTAYITGAIQYVVPPCYTCDNYTYNKEVRIMDNLKVYKLNDSEWYITPWSIDKTLAWYNKEFKCNLTTDMIQECNVYKEGMWLETTDEDDIEALGDSDEIISIVKTPQGLKRSVKFGDLMRKGESVYKYCSFKVAIEEIYDEELKEPEVIASTDF